MLPVVLPACAACSACCRGLEVELVGCQDDVPDEMVEDAGGYLVMRRKANGECIALAGGKCSIYLHRPLECRHFKRGSPECLSLVQEREDLPRPGEPVGIASAGSSA